MSTNKKAFILFAILLTQSIILICDMGSVSPNAGEILKKEGFTNVLILKGGINEWRMQNLPLV